MLRWPRRERSGYEPADALIFAGLPIQGHESDHVKWDIMSQNVYAQCMGGSGHP